jgi:hypothetical protein
VSSSDDETEDDNIIELLQKVSPSDAETEDKMSSSSGKRCHILMLKLRMKRAVIWSTIWACFSVVCMGYIAVYMS